MKSRGSALTVVLPVELRLHGVVAALAGAALVASCADPEPEIVHRTAAEQGKVLFADPSISHAQINPVACADCHAERAGDSAKKLPGAPLAGVTKRDSFWGGQENTLIGAVNHCLYYFMVADAPWTGEEDVAVNLYAYLESLEAGGDTTPQPFTIGPVVDPGAGDAKNGAGVYEAACRLCHGAKSSGAGRLYANAPKLPDETLAAHPAPDYTDADRRLVFVEKTRHGGFLGYGGTMPPMSEEVLSDAELADLLAYLGVP